VADLDRAALRKLAEAATPGPWRYNPDGAGVEGDGWVRATPPDYHEIDVVTDTYWRKEDAAFIAAAREAIPALLDALDDQDRALSLAHAEHRGVTDSLYRATHEADFLHGVLACIAETLHNHPDVTTNQSLNWCAGIAYSAALGAPSVEAEMAAKALATLRAERPATNTPAKESP
jgi:hypothetical protein